MPPPAPRSAPSRRAPAVLDEDEWTEQLEAIIERDYFPDKAKLENKLEWLQVRSARCHLCFACSAAGYGARGASARPAHLQLLDVRVLSVCQSMKPCGLRLNTKGKARPRRLVWPCSPGVSRVLAPRAWAPAREPPGASRPACPVTDRARSGGALVCLAQTGRRRVKTPLCSTLPPHATLMRRVCAGDAHGGPARDPPGAGEHCGAPRRPAHAAGRDARAGGHAELQQRAAHAGGAGPHAHGNAGVHATARRG